MYYDSILLTTLYSSYLHAWMWTGDGNYQSGHYAKNCDTQDTSVFEGKALIPHDETYRRDMMQHGKALRKKVRLLFQLWCTKFTLI
jgi:hypothetical protein